MTETFAEMPPPPPTVKHNVGPILLSLKAGQTRFIPTDKPYSVRSYVLKWAVYHKCEFRTAKREENGKPGLRIWRIK